MPERPFRCRKGRSGMVETAMISALPEKMAYFLGPEASESVLFHGELMHMP